jgi:membrane protein
MTSESARDDGSGTGPVRPDAGRGRRSRDAPAGLPGAREVLAALRRTPGAAWDGNLTDWAAALTYYAVLALFPALLVLVSLIGIAGTAGTGDFIGDVTGVLPDESRELVRSTLRDMAGRQTAAWLLAVLGTLGALWSSSNYLAVFRRALHALHGVEDTRPAWRTVPRNVLTALLLLALMVASVFVLILTGEAARTAGRLLGLRGAAVGTWNALQWPMLLCLIAGLVLVLFRSGPPATRGVRRRLPGGVLGVLLWLLASLGFALYASLAGTYSRLYGSLAGFVVFLVWLWLSNLALLTGAQLNAELARLRE